GTHGNRPEALDCVQKTAFDLLRRFVFRHSICATLHLYKPFFKVFVSSFPLKLMWTRALMVHHDGSLLRSGETAAGSILCFNLHSLPRYPSFSHSLPLYPSQHGSITRNVYADRNGLAALALP